MTACTATISPTLPRVSTMRPVRGDVMVTVALSVMTSTIGWSSLMRSPGLTSHVTISPSVTPSPMSGSLNSQRAMVLPQKLAVSTIAGKMRCASGRYSISSV